MTRKEPRRRWDEEVVKMQEEESYNFLTGALSNAKNEANRWCQMEINRVNY